MRRYVLSLLFKVTFAQIPPEEAEESDRSRLCARYRYYWIWDKAAPRPHLPEWETSFVVAMKWPHPDTFIRDILSAVKRTKGHISHFGQKTSAPHYAVWPWQLVFILWVLQVSARQRDEPSDPGVYFKVSDGKQLFEHHDSFLLSDLDLILNYINLITQQVWTEKFPLRTKRFLMEIQHSAFCHKVQCWKLK